MTIFIVLIILCLKSDDNANVIFFFVVVVVAIIINKFIIFTIQIILLLLVFVIIIITVVLKNRLPLRNITFDCYISNNKDIFIFISLATVDNVFLREEKALFLLNLANNPLQILKLRFHSVRVSLSFFL